MAKGTSTHNRGAGPYSQFDINFYRPNTHDKSGNPKAKPRDLSRAVERVSGMGLSRAITKPSVKRYGP